MSETDFRTNFMNGTKSRNRNDTDFFVFHNQLEECFMNIGDAWDRIDAATDGKEKRHVAQRPLVILTTDSRRYRSKEIVNIVLISDGLVGKVPVRVFKDGDVVIEEKLDISPAGLALFQFEPPDDGKYVAMLEQGAIERSTEFSVGHAQEAEQEAHLENSPEKNLIPFRTNRWVTLHSDDTTEISRDLKIEASGVSKVPFDLIEAVSEKVSIKFTEDLWRVWIAAYNTVEGGDLSIQEWDGVKKGDIKRVRTYSPLTAIEIFAIKYPPRDSIQAMTTSLEETGEVTNAEIPCLAEAHFAKGYVVHPPETKVEFDVPSSVKAGSRLRFGVKIETAKDSPISALLSVRDSGTHPRDIQLEAAKELWRSITSYENPEVISKDPEINAFRESMRHLMGHGRSVSGFLSLVIRTIAQRVGEDGITSADLIEKKWTVLTGKAEGMSNINVLSEPAFGQFGVDTAFYLRNSLSGVYQDIKSVNVILENDASLKETESSFDTIRCLLYLNAVRLNNYWVYLTRTLSNVLDITWFPENEDVPSRSENEVARELFSEVLGVSSLNRAKSSMNELVRYFHSKQDSLQEAIDNNEVSQLGALLAHIKTVLAEIEELDVLTSEWKKRGYEPSESPIDEAMEESTEDFEFLDGELDGELPEKQDNSIKKKAFAYTEVIEGKSEISLKKEIDLDEDYDEWSISIIVKAGHDVVFKQQRLESS